MSLLTDYMLEENCYAIACDGQLGVRLQTIAIDYHHIF